ncbi:MAG: hypothetical protein ACO2ZZ_10935 [Cyclobacteriaceae bacterium]
MKDSNSQNFIPLFQKGERAEIYGKANFNFKVLIAILTFTFCAIGGANLSLSYLEDRMSDPFVNLLSVDVPSSKASEADDLIRHLGADSLKDRYNYASITNYVEFPVAFTGPSRSMWVKGRSIEINNPILDRLVASDNLLIGTGFQNDQELGLIVSRRLLDELGYKQLPTHVHMNFNNKLVPIPVRAIVKELPELNYFIASPFFFFQRTQLGGTAFDVESNRKLTLFFNRDKDDADAIQLRKDLVSFFGSNKKYLAWDADIFYRNNNESYLMGTEYTVDFFGFRAEKSSDYDELVTDLKEQLKYDIIRYYDYEFNNVPSNFKIEADKIAINFASLEDVRAFQVYLYDNMQIEVDIAKVRDKENFAFVQVLTESISILLIIFSAISVCFYLYNVLRNHLQRIKPNLGTFLAFGLNPSYLFKLYRSLLLWFLIKAVGFSLMISFLLLLVLSVLTSSLSDYVHLFDWKLLSTLLILIGSFYYIFKHTIQNILVKTPGDLIYDR